MPPKNYSAVQKLTQSLRSYQRQFSGRNIVEKGYDALFSGRYTHRSWPKREEGFAAIQVMRQSQLRPWTNARRYVNQSQLGQQSTVAKRAATQRRNNILAAKSAASHRLNMLRDAAESMTQQKSDERVAQPAKQQSAQAATAQLSRKKLDEQRQQQKPTEQAKPAKQPKTADPKKIASKLSSLSFEQSDNAESKEKKKVTRDLRPLRDIVFGFKDNKNEDDQADQMELDDELLRRVTMQQQVLPESSISRKVIAPYSTYRTHRNRWAEFRHRMIYGPVNI
ncbi:uncharacterized protein LOC108595585 [Drosophila busckii]|uniref:uncharacterized protein LOC108595585 n=1 Tax=Drosophila busckii TaxID=30019 RepID=UPI00083EBBAF|nr:uncharacterized protein LOC108595585 [Drosophila busckii]